MIHHFKLADEKNDEKEKEKTVGDIDKNMRKDAAIKIQSNYRGYAIRKKYKASKQGIHNFKSLII